MSLKNVVKVMNFHSLLRVDRSRKAARKYSQMEEMVLEMLDNILNNRNVILDVKALQMAGGCGCKLLATIHGGSMEEVRQKDYMRYVMEQRLFERYVMMDRRRGACRIVEVYDREGKPCIRQ